MTLILSARPRPRTLTLALLATAVVTAQLVTACSETPRHRSGAAEPQSVAVTLENFKIDLPAQLRAGRVRFVVTGAGPTMHELNVASVAAAAALADGLPMNRNHLVDDLTPHPGFTHLGEVEGVDIGQRKSLTLTLTPGHYVFYCNMDGHYRAGMTTAVTVLP